jgi:hypothetical protein
MTHTDRPHSLQARSNSAETDKPYSQQTRK